MNPEVLNSAAITQTEKLTQKTPNQHEKINSNSKIKVKRWKKVIIDKRDSPQLPQRRRHLKEIEIL